MYTTIVHPIRKALCLSMNEYAVLDSIYHLSNNTKYGGWAVISRQRLADDLDLSKRHIIRMIDTLITKGYVIRDETSKFLRATEIYCKMIQNKSEWAIADNTNKLVSAPMVLNCHSTGDIMSSEVVTFGHPSGDILSPNNNRYNNIDNNIDKRKLEFASTLDKFRDLYTNEMLDEFLAYWGEPNKSNTKFRYELQKTWDLERRLKTWHKNENKFTFGKPNTPNNQNTYKEL